MKIFFYGDFNERRSFGWRLWVWWMGNAAEVVAMRELSPEGQKAHVKKLWLEDPKSYYEW